MTDEKQLRAMLADVHRYRKWAWQATIINATFLLFDVAFAAGKHTTIGRVLVFGLIGGQLFFTIRAWRYLLESWSMIAQIKKMDKGPEPFPPP